ncbi:MAG: DUF1080 domain-containing protein [Planctomycetaceae bacterium]|nr:DUF1080 domain-containing protein [Planctomycetaceae bacterium]MBQ2822161.1 DUF1080 domain-containing protein [Thermoguttaceae bacterium]
MKSRKNLFILIFGILFSVLFFQCQLVGAQTEDTVSSAVLAKPDADGWISLFNGKDLSGWKIPPFGGEGEVTVEDGIMTIQMGAMVSGIAFDQAFPFKTNYEVEVEAMRTMGFDFYSAITFPIGEKGYSTFINGGWGGGVFGLSCVNGYDASENETMELVQTKNDVWNVFRVRVYEDRIECWRDDQKIVNCPREGNEFSTRFEVEYTQPFGISNYCSETKIKSIRIRELK